MEERCESTWGYGFDRVPFSGQSIKTFKIKLYDDIRKEFSFALNSSASSSPFAPQCLSVSKVQSFSVTLWGMFFPQINHCCHTKFSHSCSPPFFSSSSSSIPSAIFLSLCVTHNYAIIDIFYSDPAPLLLLCCHSVAFF